MASFFPRMTRALLTAGAAGFALAATAPAFAQEVDRIVAFGDSYADIGNLFRIVPAPTIPNPFPTGRFSGGTNFVDTISDLLQIPQVNYAIGGATTGSFNVATNSLPGFTQQYTGATIGGYTGFNAATQRLNATDLVAISIGGNDARAYALGGGSVAGAPAAAMVAAQQATTGINALRSAGGQTFLFLAGNTGQLPELAPNPAAAAAAGAFSTTYLTQMRASLGQLSAGGATVHYLDLSKMFASIQADPAAFGITNMGPCPAALCVPAQSAAKGYLFYYDGLHLTSDGFRIVGQYAVAQLNGPLTFQAQTDLGLRNMQNFGRTLEGRIDNSAQRMGKSPLEGLSLFAVGTLGEAKQMGSSQGNPYDYESVGAAIGAEYAPNDNMILGLAGAWSRPRSDFNRGGGSVRARSWQIGGYAGFATGSLFVQGHAAYGHYDYRVQRAAVIDLLNATPKGNGYSLGAKGGYLVDLGRFRFGPVAGIDYAHSSIDAYTESGDAVLTQNVSKQKADALVGFAGVEFRGQYGGDRGALEPYVTGGIESVLDSKGRIVAFSGTASPEIVNHFSIAGQDSQAYGRIGGGARLTLSDMLSIDVNLSATIERNAGNEQSGFAGLTLNF